MESRDREVSEWARVHVLKSSLDESKLEQRVISANEAEAVSQQRLATAEAEIAELGQKLVSSRRYLICVYIHCSVYLLKYNGRCALFYIIFSIKMISCAGFQWLRDLLSQSGILESKHEECEAYLSEIEVWITLCILLLGHGYQYLV
jgi:hypothetical protein